MTKSQLLWRAMVALTSMPLVNHSLVCVAWKIVSNSLRRMNLYRRPFATSRPRLLTRWRKMTRSSCTHQQQRIVVNLVKYRAQRRIELWSLERSCSHLRDTGLGYWGFAFNVLCLHKWSCFFVSSGVTRANMHIPIRPFLSPGKKIAQSAQFFYPVRKKERYMPGLHWVE